MLPAEAPRAYNVAVPARIVLWQHVGDLRPLSNSIEEKWLARAGDRARDTELVCQPLATRPPPPLEMCVYVRNNITCSRVHNLEFLEFTTIWLRLQFQSLTKYICAVYFSPNASDYVKFFDYLTSKVEYIVSHSPNAEISILGDFNVHHQLWLSSSFTDQSGEQSFNFA